MKDQIFHWGESTEQLLECAPVSSNLGVGKSGLLFMLLDSRPDLPEGARHLPQHSVGLATVPAPFSEAKTGGDRSSILRRKRWDKE